MVDWRSEQTETFWVFLTQNAVIFSLGAYIWHFMLTLHAVELRLVQGRLVWSIPHIPYFAARYFHLVAFILLAVLIQKRSDFGCQSACTIRSILVFGYVALAASSTNLGFRALMIWRRNIYAWGFLIARCFVHWVLAVQMGIMSVSLEWNAPRTECTIDYAHMRRQAIIFLLYTLAGAVVYLIFTVVGLYREQHSHKSRLRSILLTHSVVYLIITCVTLIPMTVMLLLNLNTGISLLFIAPGTTASVITSSSAVIALLKMREQGPSTHSGARRPRFLRFPSQTQTQPTPDRCTLEALSRPPPEETQSTTTFKGGYEFTSHINITSSACRSSGDFA